MLDSYTVIGVHAAGLDDLESLRIAMENRLRSLTTGGMSESGLLWGSTFDPSDPEIIKLVEKYTEFVERVGATELDVIKVVEQAIKNSPMAEYVKNAKGVGYKQAARLLASIGDPYWHAVEDRPRTVGELWAYCGLDVRGGAAPKRTKGQQSNWNSDARKRAWLIAKSVEKQRSGKYREIYDQTKLHYAGAVHQSKCPQCHAEAGDPLKPGHIQSRALRKVAKAVLKDMWIASRDAHNNSSSSFRGC